MVKTYIISPDGRSITCRRCGMTSHNRNDVAQRYCGHCHVFHEDPRIREAAVEEAKCLLIAAGGPAVILAGMPAANEALDAIERRRLDEVPPERRVEEAKKFAAARSALADLEAGIQELLE